MLMVLGQWNVKRKREKKWCFHLEVFVQGVCVITYQGKILSFCCGLFYTIEKLHFGKASSTKEIRCIAHTEDQQQQKKKNVPDILSLRGEVHHCALHFWGRFRASSEYLWWNPFSFLFTFCLDRSSAQSGWFHNWMLFMFLWPFLELYLHTKIL